MSTDEIAPGRKYYAVTPHNSTDFAIAFRAFHCNVAGDVAVVDHDGTVTVFTCLAGVTYPYGGKRINSTGTTATGIKAISAQDHLRG